MWLLEGTFSLARPWGGGAGLVLRQVLEASSPRQPFCPQVPPSLDGTDGQPFRNLQGRLLCLTSGTRFGDTPVLHLYVIGLAQWVSTWRPSLSSGFLFMNPNLETKTRNSVLKGVSSAGSGSFRETAGNWNPCPLVYVLLWCCFLDFSTMMGMSCYQ